LITPPFLFKDLKMKATSRVSGWPQILPLALALLSSATTPASAQGLKLNTFPDSISCKVEPYYRHRSDGKAGREVLLKFKGSKLYRQATIEILSENRRETVKLSAQSAGLDSAAILLPPEVGVTGETEVKLILRQGKNRLEQTIQVQPLRHWTVYVYPHSHVDIGYSNTQANVEFIHKLNIDQGIKLARSTRNYPDGARYKWNTEVMWPFERYYASATPEKRKRLIEALRRGELCLDAAYVHLLTSSSSDEEMIQSVRARGEAAKLTGQPMDAYVQVDIPGMAWGLVEVLSHEGIRYIMMMPNGTRGNDSMVTEFRYKPFWWLGPDGKSRVLFLNAGGYGAGMEKGGKTGRPWFGQRDRAKIPEAIKTDNPRQDFLDNHLFRELPSLEKSHYPYDIFVTTWAMWDNALLDADLPRAVKSWNEDYAYPHLVIASAHDIMLTIEKRYGDTLPVVRGDFTEYWTDGLGTAARQTRMNRNAKDRLTQAETLWPMLRPGVAAPRADFDEAWRYILLSTEHTFCTENPAEPYFQDAIWKVKQSYFQEAENRSQSLLDDALAPATDKSNGALGPVAGPSNGGVAVINSNSWQHGGLVTLTPAESQLGDRVLDDEGREVLAQRLSSGELVFFSGDVPAFSSRHYRVVAGRCSLASTSKFAQNLLDNGKVQVVIDPSTGNISRLLETASGRDFVDEKVNGGLNAFRWQPARDSGDARPDTVMSISLKESGPLVGEIEIKSKAPGCRSVTRSVRLIHNQPWVEITNVVDKLPLLAKDGVHFAFPFNVPEGKTRVDIPWAVMELEKDQWPAANRAWTAAQHFVDVSNDTLGVTWCSLDAPLIESGTITANNTAGWDGKGDVWPAKLPMSSTIYSWVMNNHWFTNTPLAQDGPVAFRYRILIHGKYDASRANRFGLEQSQGLIALAANSNPISEPIVAITSDRVCATILKSTADGKAVILRLRSFSDKDESVKLSWLARRPRSVRVCEKGEDPGKREASREVTVPAMGFVTLCAEW
jgi:alpha-mannosidase